MSGGDVEGTGRAAVDARPPARPAAVSLDRATEDAATGIDAGVVGAAVDVRGGPRRPQAVGTVLASHGGSVVLERLVRRVRPACSSPGTHVAVPSRWSSPSSHAASATTAAIRCGPPGTRPTAVLPVSMAGSRLGSYVHLPADVAHGRAVAAPAPMTPRRGAR
jgi:undecaprenyl-diphosphatase